MHKLRPWPRRARRGTLWFVREFRVTRRRRGACIHPSVRSLRLPPGVTGTVVEVRVFNRHGVDKDERAMAIEREEIERLAKDRDDEQAILDRNVYSRLAELLENRQGIAGPKGFKKDTKITRSVLEEYPKSQWWLFASPNDKLMAEIEAMHKQYDESKKGLEQRFLDKVEKLQRGDELPPGVMKMVKVFVAVKRKIQPGDKMAGRHGNKGVVSRIVPQEDMPYLEDGTPVDLVLNPLGVPSRMNVGQILETHLGWACANLGRQIGQMIDAVNKGDTKTAELRKQLKEVYGERTYKSDLMELEDNELVELAEGLRKGVPVASPVFDGAREDDIVQMLERAGLKNSGQVILTDGRTGEWVDKALAAVARRMGVELAWLGEGRGVEPSRQASEVALTGQPSNLLRVQSERFGFLEAEDTRAADSFRNSCHVCHYSSTCIHMELFQHTSSA